MSAKTVHQVLGKLGTQRGADNERLTFDACQLPSRPAWMTSARRATRAEDHDGIDIVVDSDVGKLFVQVKSSRRGKAEFAERRRRAQVVVIVVKSGDSLEAILRKIVGGLAPIRAVYLRERG